MAYTPSPTYSTYETKEVPLVYPLGVRKGQLLTEANGSSTGFQVLPDSRMMNLIPKKFITGDKEAYIAVSRDPIYSTGVGTSMQARGCYVWEKTPGTSYYFAVFDNKIYTGTDGVTWTNVTSFTTTTNYESPVGFSEFLDATNVKKLVIVDGVEGYVFTTNAAGTKIVDADFPSPHLPYPIFLDGFLFLAKKATGDIYNSDLNDPAAWTAGSYISAEINPDDLQALAKVNNYLLAIGTQSCEYFYDAANPTASPLARVEGATLPFGCIIPTSIKGNKNSLFMIANNQDGGMVLKMIEDQKHTTIDAPVVMKAVYETTAAGGLLSTYVRAFLIRQSGLLMYAVNLNLINGSCYVYHIDADVWTEFTINASTSGTVHNFFPVHFTAPAITTMESTFVQGMGFFGRFRANSIYGYDTIPAGNRPLICHLQTTKQMFGTMNYKFMSRLGLVCDFNTYNEATTVTLGYSDDDYNTWTTRDIVICTGVTPSTQIDFPFVTQLGKFRQRAFSLTYSGNALIRLFGIQVDINKGQQ